MSNFVYSIVPSLFELKGKEFICCTAKRCLVFSYDVVAQGYDNSKLLQACTRKK